MWTNFLESYLKSSMIQLYLAQKNIHVRNVNTEKQSSSRANQGELKMTWDSTMSARMPSVLINGLNKHTSRSLFISSVTTCLWHELSAKKSPSMEVKQQLQCKCSLLSVMGGAGGQLSSCPKVEEWVHKYHLPHGWPSGGGLESPTDSRDSLEPLLEPSFE